MMKRAFAALAVTLLLASSAQADIWVNELHYDNTGGDSGEFLEVVVSPAESGIDLSTVTLNLYNGSNGTIYDSSTLDTFVAGSNVDGFQFYTWAPSSIQNGAPDGWSLDVAGTLLEFHSYEGELTATEGIATGLTSTDIGVTEGGGTPIGESLQLTGAGSTAADFTWAAPSAETVGLLNNGQSFSAVPEPTSAGILGLIALTGCLVRRRK